MNSKAPPEAGPTPADLPAVLRRCIGDAHVLAGAEEMAPYLVDWRHRFTGKALAVALPASAEEAAAVVALCARAGASVVPQGGNTGLVGGATPGNDGSTVVVATKRMNRILAVDTANDTITAEAGCTLQAVQEAAAAAGRLFALSLASEGSCSIGGNLATNAGGTQVLRYGNAREQVLGLEVVLPDGRIWHGLRGLRKDNTGYDLKHLFIGSEGTLGLICAATLRLYPLPRAQRTAVAAVPSLAAAEALLTRLRGDAGAALTAFELMGAGALGVVARAFSQRALPFSPPPPWTVLLELSDHEGEAHAEASLERSLAAALAEGEIRDAVVARSGSESASLWRLRESISEAQSRLGGNVKNDISLPVSRIAGFVATTLDALRARWPWIDPVVFGHLGDGNLHFNLGVRPGDDLQLAFTHENEIRELVDDAVSAHQGSISAEHGIGQLKRESLLRHKSAVEIDLMRAVKHAIDPEGRFNPGKLL